MSSKACGGNLAVSNTWFFLEAGDLLFWHPILHPNSMQNNAFWTIFQGFEILFDLLLGVQDTIFRYSFRSRVEES